MTYEECLDLVMAYGSIREEIGKQTDAMQRNKAIVDASERIADFIASMMSVDKSAKNECTKDYCPI